MSKDTEQVTARDGDSRAGTISSHSCHCLRLTIGHVLFCTAGHFHSPRLDVLTRNSHENAEWPIWRLSDHAGSRGRRLTGEA